MEEQKDGVNDVIYSNLFFPQIIKDLNTPIRDWTLPGLPSGFSLSIKRDDMTGSTLSGNKVRKLEFLLADALVKGSDCVLTCGGIQSNHCRATAVAARELGLDCYLFLRHKEEVINQSNNQ
ncbi:putative D-cysteine desulfhydrase 1, mitochondrial [Exaiptasia diaphana]|nr:putative D-cysteine desulfhydrase 1, mitochondrial [Exaiptasia diaphana]